MKKTVLTTPFGASAVIYHQGAHVASWIPSPQLGEQIFVAKQSEFTAGKAIRGGVPICFPQFGAFGNGVKHGFARNVEWQLTSVNDDQTVALFTLCSNESTRALWPHDFELTLGVYLTPNQLAMELTVKNTGQKSFEFGGALHTYLCVNDFTQAAVQDLNGVTYWDNGTSLNDKKLFDSQALTFAGAIDRVYFDAPNALVLNEAGTPKHITKTGFRDVVIWNPGPEGAKGLSDMGDNEYPSMLCIEAAIVDQPIILEAGQSWQGEQVIAV